MILILLLFSKYFDHYKFRSNYLVVICYMYIATLMYIKSKFDGMLGSQI